MRIAAIDIGGTAIKAGIWQDGELCELQEVDTDAKLGGSHILECVTGILESFDGFDGIGISTAGQVDTMDGSIYYANENIPDYTGMKLKELLEERFQVPVSVENDVNAAALGEAWVGGAADIPSFLCLTYGTGVGGAIVIDGQIYTGHRWSAGSFGGIVVHPEQMRAGVEFSGCYEKYASVTALVAKAGKLDPTLCNGRKIFESMDHAEVRALVDNWIDEIVYGLVTLIHVLNPSDIILGGGVMAQDYVLEGIRERLPLYVSPGFLPVNINRALLGNQAGMYGAVHGVLEVLEKGVS